MILNFTEEESQFLKAVSEWVESDVAPCTRAWEQSTFPDDIWRVTAELGVTNCILPKALGGRGYSCATYAEMCRIIAKGDPALSMNVAAINALCVAHFEHFANDEQRAKYLPGVLSGDIPLAWGLTEPDAGSDALAKALTLAGRTEEALAAFKKAVRWDPKDRELHVNGPPAVDVKMDYAILLAKSGKGDEAKMVYYSAMRTYNYSTSRYVEPFPFLVVFDPDPDMTAWEYSADRFVAAAMMLKAPDMGAPEARAATEEVRRMEPTWVVPALFQASRLWMGPKRAELLQLAESLAKTDEEKAWVRAYQDVEKIREPSEWNQRQAEVAKKLAEIGVARRKASTVLRQSKLDLEKNHGKVAG